MPSSPAPAHHAELRLREAVRMAPRRRKKHWMLGVLALAARFNPDPAL